MQFASHLSSSGNRLFRWRSLLPLALLPAFALSLADYRFPLGSEAGALAWELVCLTVALLGLAIRIAVVGTAPTGTSGRNTRVQRADSLNTTGMYSVVRHPLYLGNSLMLFGLAMLPFTWYLPLIVMLAAALYYERIIFVEEAYLEEQYADGFRRWAAETPALIPRWSAWRPAALPFSWRTALRGEIYAAFAIISGLFAMDLVQDYIARGEIRLSRVWTPLFVVGAALFYGVRLVKKKTELLTVEGR